jgi:membrane protein DedA with SNARE-associated domain
VTTAQLPPEIAAGIGEAGRRDARRWLILMGTLGTASTIGWASSLYLVNHAPLLLIAMSPIGRHLLLVAPSVDPVAFVIVGTLRRLTFYLGSFHLGRIAGPSGLVWMESRFSRVAWWVRWLERLFERFGHPILVAFPGPTVSALSGMSGMSQWLFLLLAGIGLVFRMMIIVVVADWFRVPIEQLLVLIEAYWIPGTIGMVIVVYFYDRRRRKMFRSLSEKAATGEGGSAS